MYKYLPFLVIIYKKGGINMAVAIYLRRSLFDQDSLSIETQLNYCKQKLLPDEEYDVYEDNGYSGKSLDRPQMNKFIQNMNKYTRLIVFKLDRCSRNLLDFANLLDKLQKNNVQFISATENLDTTTPTGRAMINIIATFAQLERETIAERVRVNYYQRALDGRFLGGTLQFGFVNTNVIIDNKKVPILRYKEETIPIIQEIFNMYAHTQKSLGDISRHLNNNNIKSCQGANFDSSKVSRVLRNPLYVKADVDIYNYYSEYTKTNDISEFIGVNACNIYSDKLTLTYHEGIIDSDVWLKCQYKLNKNKSIINKRKSQYSWLSTLMKCKYCGRKISVCKNKKLYGICNGKYLTNECLRTDTIYVDEVHTAVAEEIIKKLDELKKVKVKKNDDNDIKIQITKIDNDIQSYTEKILMANETVMKIINEKIDELTKEKQMLMDKLLQEKANTIGDNIADVDFNGLSLEEKRDIACILIDKIIVGSDDINIIFRV